MSKLKLLDLDLSDNQSDSHLNIPKSNNEEPEEVPVHLFISPSHSVSSSSHSSGHPAERLSNKIQETTFVTIENHPDTLVKKDNEVGSSPSISPLTISSGNDEITSPTSIPRSIPRRRNKIQDIDHTSITKIKDPLRRRSDGESLADAEGARSITSMSDHVSDNLSYKDRLRDHINTVRERAVETMSRPQSRSQSRTHSRMKMLLANKAVKSEDLLKREERDVNAALERHHQLRTQWRQLSHEILRKKTEKDGYEFFTEHNEGGIQVRLEVEEPISPALTDKSKDGKITAAECLNLEIEYEPIVWQSAALPPDTSQKFNALLFYPSSNQVPIDEKIESGLNVRYIEEEGLYVEKKGQRLKSQKNHLEQRLLKVPEGKKWFGLDGDFLGKPIELEYNLEIHQTISKGIEFKFPTLADEHHSSKLEPIVLDIELLAIRFTHHSLFSREHVLAQRILDLSRKWRHLRQTDSARRLKGQLDALRRTRDSSKEGNLDRLNEDIVCVSNKWLSESKLESQVQTNLITTWKDLQRLREEQGYRNTSVQIVVKQKPKEDVEDWEEMLKIEIAEALNEAKRQNKKQKIIYDKELEIWREKLALAEEQINEEGDEIASAPQPPTPVPTVDERAIENAIRDKFKASFGSADDPETEFIVADLGSPTASSDSREEARRGALKKQELVIKLLCNEREVYRSEMKHLSFLFTVKFGQRFAVRLLEWPKTLSLDLIENGRSLCRVYLPFPNRLTTVETADVERHEFSCSCVVSHSHTGVGCGRDIIPCPGGSELNSRPVCLFTTGTAALRFGWAVNIAGDLMAPPPSFWNIQRTKDGNEKLAKTYSEVAKLRDWVEKAGLDPNDPSNAHLFKMLENRTTETAQTKTGIEELEFCSAEDIANNPRLRLLRLRDQGEPEFRGFQMVPLSEKLIHPDIFKAYEARVAKPDTQEIVLDPIDNHRAVGRKRMEQIRQTVLQRCRQARQHRRLADVVTEDQVPDLSTLGLTIMRWFRPKRPLRPERKQRKKVPVQNLEGQNVNIVVNVVRAFEVPVRKDMDSMSANESVDGFSLVNVRPYVSATFRGETVRTNAAEGANPTWNQDLVLPIRTSTGDFSSGALLGMRDSLFLHLFDEVVVDLVDEEILRDTTIHQRLEKHWLAALEIPFSTLYCNSRVEGTFQLYSPPVLLGYEREAHRLTGGSLPQRDATYLTLFITVQPALNPPEPFLDVFDTSEEPEIESHLKGWQMEVSSLFPSRKVRPLVSMSTASAVCITRLIRPIPPPKLLISEDIPITAAAAARFVARIPTMASATFYPGLLDVWLTCDQMVNMLHGGVEDHAVLLCCFLLDMGHPAYLLLGVGIPHGSSAYVLVNSPGSETIWDPTTGCKYSVRDSFCPLQKVHSLVSNINIWANIQDDDSLRRVRFDVTKRADWLPAFNKNVSAPSESVQPALIDFKETSKQAVLALQDKLENRLRDCMMKWRRRQRTQWNRYCAATMRKLLPKLEQATWDTGDAVSPDHWQGLNHILASHKICGFPINMAYTDMEAVMEAVKATGVDCNESEEAEFALTVYIHPYPSDVLSLWVYVASLMRRR